MDLIRYRKTNKPGDIWIKPAKRDLEIFKHCAGGRVAVPSRVFYREVDQILHLHKIYHLSYKDET